jgi:hypothetical protein
LKMAARTDEAAAVAEATLAGLQNAPTVPLALHTTLRIAAAEVALMQGRHAQGLAALQALQGGAQAPTTQLAQQPQPTANARPPIALVLAEQHLALGVALRQQDPAQALALTNQACEALRAAGLEATLRLARCHAVMAWMQGLATGPNDASAWATARAAFVTARSELDTHVPPQHALRAELLVAESELLAPGSADAAKLQREGRAMFQSVVGQPMPWPMWVLH